VQASPYAFASLRKIFEQILEHDCLITFQTNNLDHIAFSSQDYSSFSFLKCYVAEQHEEEQHEEERLFKGVLDKLTLIGDHGPALFLIDMDFANMALQEGSSIMTPGSTVD
jgi:ferritin